MNEWKAVEAFMNANRKTYIVCTTNRILEKRKENPNKSKIKEYEEKILEVMDAMDIAPFDENGNKRKLNPFTLTFVAMVTKEEEEPKNPLEYIKIWNKTVQEILDGKRSLRDLNKDEE